MTESRRTLYPDIEPFDSGFLQVSPLHRVYYEQCGNPRGKPAVFLHGGPGAGCNAKSRRFFDPRHYRIVLFDQRGCGRSTPHAELTDNTTWHLVADIEALREHLGVARWQVFGGSWGSTLALAYAQTHPERVTELVLRGIFMLRRWELEWFYQKGCDAVFPDAWEDFLKPIPEVERGELMSAYYRRLAGPDPAMRLAAARAWSIWEGATSFLLAGSGAHRIERRGRVRARVRAHRVSLLRSRRILRARRSAASQLASPARNPGGHRAGPLRHRVPAAQRLGSAPRVVGSGFAHRRRRGTFGVRTRHHARAHRCDRALPLISRLASEVLRRRKRKRPASAGLFFSIVDRVRARISARVSRRLLRRP